MLDMQSVLLGNLSNEVYRGLNASRNVGTWTTPRGLPIVLQTRQRPTLSGQKFSPSKIDLTTEIKSNYSNSFPKLKMLAEWSIGIGNAQRETRELFSCSMQLQTAVPFAPPWRGSRTSRISWGVLKASPNSCAVFSKETKETPNLICQVNSFRDALFNRWIHDVTPCFPFELQNAGNQAIGLSWCISKQSMWSGKAIIADAGTLLTVTKKRCNRC